MTFIMSLFLAFSAHAQYQQSAFSFSMAGAEPGCAKVSYFYTNYDFPHLDKGDASFVRFYFSPDDPDSIDETSRYQEATFYKDADDRWAISPNEFCGFPAGKMNFKSGLVRDDGTVLEFQDNFDPDSNSIDIAPEKP